MREIQKQRFFHQQVKNILILNKNPEKQFQWLVAKLYRNCLTPANDAQTQMEDVHEISHTWKGVSFKNATVCIVVLILRFISSIINSSYTKLSTTQTGRLQTGVSYYPLPKKNTDLKSTQTSSNQTSSNKTSSNQPVSNKTATIKNNKRAPSHNSCTDTLHHGSWHNMKLHGFERIDAKTNKTITNPWNPNYPVVWPPFKPWNEQNYTGDWKPENDCDLKSEFSKNELSKCFSGKHIHFIGDSRTRQLYASMVALFKNETFFVDHKGVMNDRVIIDGISSISFAYSQCFHCTGNRRILHLKTNILSSVKRRLREIRIDLVKNRENDQQPKLIVIIGGHILHPAFHFFEKDRLLDWNSTDWIRSQEKTGRTWVKALINGLKYEVLPELLKLIKKYNYLQISFLATHAKLSQPKHRVLYRTLLLEYNIQLKKAISQTLELQSYEEHFEADPFFQGKLQNLTVGVDEKRLNFLEVLEKIGETPGEKIPLAVDSTHLNWHGSKNLQNVQVPRKVFF